MGKFGTLEEAAEKIKEEERSQQEDFETKYKFFVIEVQVMTVADDCGDIVFSNKVERKV